ncbi:J domain-containing protein [Lysinibacillus agricola]|uniref:J domain-containing protein n=1 Tax=Lysinibacillus agricola TaxID=2590012 RepID=A0ABX7APS4_9BACI|nr:MULTISPECIES: DnaJ domain-containing protein [Lysinibacillus]KOS61850.1 molecular chaperone DnaJ [Lysinibacillus sp. FJAT-14222]QQP11225.1 J domain-containing protein [Lysinibacillus agricola]
MKTHYETLGVSRDATQEQIKLAYRKLSKKHHPDVSGGNKESEKIFLEVTEAYKVLKDQASREAYDARLDGAGQSWNDRQTHEKQSSRQQSTEKKPDFNMDNIEKNFEHFFGFNPKTKEMSSALNKNAKKNPLDTTDLFERFFNK